MLKARLKLVLGKCLTWVMFIAHLRECLLDNIGKWQDIMLVIFSAYKDIYI